MGMFDVDDIDASLCTHGFYGFADLDNGTWEIAAYDINFDLCPEQCPEGEVCQYCGYDRFVALRDEYEHFIPVLSIGGWNAGKVQVGKALFKSAGACQTIRSKTDFSDVSD